MGQKGRYLEDIEGSSSEILRSWSSLTSSIQFFPQGIFPENFIFICLFEVCQEWGGREDNNLKDIDMEDMVIPDIMNYVFFTLRKIP